MKTKIAKEVAEAIMGNEEDARLILVKVASDIGGNTGEILRREESATKKDLTTKEGVHFILFGEAYPSKGGYTWA